MQVFDLTRLRGLETDTSQTRSFTEDVHYDGVGNTHNIAINEETGYAYLIGTNTCDGGSHIVDIREPKAPEFAGCVDEDGYTHDNQCVVYTGPDAQYAGQRDLLRLQRGLADDRGRDREGRDRRASAAVAACPYAGSAYTHQGWLTPDQRYVLMNDELDEQDNGVNTTTRIVDVTDAHEAAADRQLPCIPSPRSTTTTTSRSPRPTSPTTARACGSSTSARWPTERSSTSGFFDVFPADDEAEFNGTWSNYPYFASGNIIVSGHRAGAVRTAPDGGRGRNRRPVSRGDRRRRRSRHPPRLRRPRRPPASPARRRPRRRPQPRLPRSRPRPRPRRRPARWRRVAGRLAESRRPGAAASADRPTNCATRTASPRSRSAPPARVSRSASSAAVPHP